MEPIRVLHCLGGLCDGGMSVMIMNYLRALDRTKVIFDFLLMSEKSFFDDEALSLGSRIFRVPPRRSNPFNHYKAVDNFFDEHKEYKIVHVHQGVNYYYMLQSAYRHNVPNRIVHCHTVDGNHLKYMGWYLKLIGRKIICDMGTHYLSCSDQSAPELFTKQIVDENKYTVLKNAIDGSVFRYSPNKRDEFRRKYNIPNDKLVVGNVARFDYPKNHTFILDVFSELLKVKPNAYLVLVGDGHLRSSIENKIKALELQDNVKLLGSIKEVSEILHVIDIVLFPSLFEGLPLSLVEAQSSGLPCVISDSISDEIICISRLIQSLSLSAESKIWAASIVNFYKEFNRKDVYDEFVFSGYDINSNVSWLTNFYINMINGK